MTGPQQYKTCSACSVLKPVDDFYQRKNGRREARCKPCIITANNAAKAEQRRLAREALAALPPAEVKTCSKCGEPHHVSDYYKGFAQCKACFRKHMKAYYERPDVRERKIVTDKAYNEANREKIRDKNLRKYGLTAAQYDARYDQQGGRCALCGAEGSRAGTGEGGRTSVLCVDHDHDTGAIRGLLCHTCNRGIGLFGDNIEMLEQAIAYLKRMSAKEALA